MWQMGSKCWNRFPDRSEGDVRRTRSGGGDAIRKNFLRGLMYRATLHGSYEGAARRIELGEEKEAQMGDLGVFHFT